MKIGLFGLPSTGKTTVFKALSGLKMETGGKEKWSSQNRSSTKVPDERLDLLHTYFPKAKKVPATIEYTEISSVSGKKDTSAISDSLLGNLRAVDAIAHIVRAFDSDAVAHVKGSVNYKRDISDINSDLILADLHVIEKNLEKLERNLKAGKKQELLLKQTILLKCKDALEKEMPIRQCEFNPSELELLQPYQFLTQKPLMLVLNIGEDQNGEEIVKTVEEMFQDDPKVLVTGICGNIEMEIAQLEEEEQEMFLEEMGLKEPALNRFITQSFKLLGLIVFFTIGDDEVRAWTLKTDQPVTKAAGTIHTDLERGFIRAEVFTYEELVAVNGSEAKLKETGKVRLEGKNYIVQDADIISIRFNVKK